MVLFNGKSAMRPESFLADIARKLVVISREDPSGNSWRIATGLLLVSDVHHGGLSAAADLVARIYQLRSASGCAIDLHCPGWKQDASQKKSAVFNLEEFNRWRHLLMQFGFAELGGGADLILVDAERSENRFWLHFDQAIRIDLIRATGKDGFATPLALFEQLIASVAALAQTAEQPDEASGIAFSRRLKLVYARRTLIDLLWRKFARTTAKDALLRISTKGIGQRVNMLELDEAYQSAP